MAHTLSIPIRQVVIGRFGGLYTDADQRDLPLGASPLVSDCDFLIGDTTIRPGLVSIQAFGGATIPGGPAISTIKPMTGPVGTVVTITGSNFGATQTTSMVTFNGITATPTAWATGSITVPVPAGASAGPVIVIVGGVPSNPASFNVTNPGGGGGGGQTGPKINLVDITGGVTVPGGSTMGISFSLQKPYPSYLAAGDTVTVAGTGLYDGNFTVAALSPGPDPFGATLTAGANTQTAILMNTGYVQFPATKAVAIRNYPPASVRVAAAPATGISPTASLMYIRSAQFIWVNSVGPVTMFQADDGTFWVDYGVSGNATQIYPLTTTQYATPFLNNARMLSETFGQYEFCGLGNWGDILASIPLQGTDQPRTFTVPAGVPSSGPAAAIGVASGSPQSATINTSFAAPLQARVQDSSGNPKSGVSVLFTAPSSGAGGTFGALNNNVLTFSTLTDTTGTATSATFFANGTVGSYNIVATALSASIPAAADFLLNNLPIGSTGGGAAVNTLVPVRQNLVAISGQGGTIPSGLPGAGQQSIAIDLGNVQVHPNLTPNDKLSVHGTGVYDGVHTVSQIQQPGLINAFGGPGVGSGPISGKGYVQYELVTIITTPSYGPPISSSQVISGAVPNGYNGTCTVRQSGPQLVVTLPGASALANGSGGSIAPATRRGYVSTTAATTVQPQFDRVSQTAPASNSWVAAGSGNFTGSGNPLGDGQRYAVLLYQMRNGYITPASMPQAFQTKSNTGMTFSNLPTGPPEVQYIIVAVTTALPGPVPPVPDDNIGGPYFWIPLTQANTTVAPNGTPTITVTLTDVDITSGVNITAPGNYLLTGHQRELGEFVKVVNYGGRAFYLGERVKTDNLVNMTFDGGTETNPAPSKFIPGWVQSGTLLSWYITGSPIYGQSLAIQNTQAATVNDGGGITDYLWQNAGKDSYGAPILLPSVQYNARITAWADPVAAGTATVALIQGTPTTTAPATTVLTTTPTEYTLTNITQAATSPNLSLYPLNLPAGGTVYVDRIEIYPAINPVWGTQLIGSYIENYQAVDAQSGPIDTSEYTYELQTNAFRFLPNLYITTDSHTFSTSVSEGEPSSWQIQELSNTVGCVGPAAADVGEEYVVVADRRGVFLFDGGNHIKITQEIHNLWEMIYWPSATSIWVKNDTHRSRLYVGIPLVTPNRWLPNAPPMSAPAIPNVILMCNYTGLSSGAEIAGSAGVRGTYTGHLLAHDFTRKWSPWLIPSAYGTVVMGGALSGSRAGDQEVWFGGEGNATVWHLDASAKTDGGNVIQQVYTTYGFQDEDTADALQLMHVRRLYSYMTVNALGQGGLVLTSYPDSLDSPYGGDVQPAVQLQPVQRERNIPINEACGKVFLKFSTDGNPGSYFTLHNIVLGVQPDNWIPITGSDEGEIFNGKFGGAQ